MRHLPVFCLLAVLLVAAASDTPQEEPLKGWKKGRGWGWIWGKTDEIGALNAMTPATRLAALSLVKEGKVYDLGVTYSRRSFIWPGHSPGEVMSFRTPEGVKRMKDHPFVLPEANAAGLPVIGSRSGGVPSAVLDGETGLLAEEGDVVGTAAAIEILINDPELRRRLSDRAVGWARHHDWNCVIRDFLSLYE